MKALYRLGSGAVALALLQQQLLLRRSPRLEMVRPALASSGPGALDLRFSRPMQIASLTKESQLQPALSHHWLGAGSSPRLLLNPGNTVQSPLHLLLRGKDLRGLSMAPQNWWWDPRPRIVAVVSRDGGEQVQLQDHDGSWQVLSPVWKTVPTLQPLGDGSGVVMAGADSQGRLEVWRLPIKQRNLSPSKQGLAPPQPGSPRRLSRAPLLFAAMSSNRRGDLLLQSASEASGQAETEIWDAKGQHSPLKVETSGPIRLVPQGGAMVVPHPEGLILMRLPGQPQQRQILPGSRDLSSYCPTGGRALLIHHRPDFTRSLELVEPGQPPRSLWQGSEGVTGSACDRSGDRVWLLLIDGVGQPRLQILALNRAGRILNQKVLTGWEQEPGTGLDFDPSRNQLLMALRPLPNNLDSSPQTAGIAAKPALIDATTLELSIQNKPIREVRWLPAG